MRYRAIQEYDRRYPIWLMCRVLAVSPVDYDAWSARPESVRGATKRALVAKIQVIHRASRETYGRPSIWDALVKQGHRDAEHRIARLMRAEGIRVKTVKTWQATTPSNHRMPWRQTRVRSLLGQQALTMAIHHCAMLPRRGVLRHSDRGSQYAATAYQQLLTTHGMTDSMSHLGNCWAVSSSKCNG